MKIFERNELFVMRKSGDFGNLVIQGQEKFWWSFGAEFNNLMDFGLFKLIWTRYFDGYFDQDRKLYNCVSFSKNGSIGDVLEDGPQIAVWLNENFAVATNLNEFWSFSALSST